jgi:hypothetical protein
MSVTRSASAQRQRAARPGHGAEMTAGVDWYAEAIPAAEALYEAYLEGRR